MARLPANYSGERRSAHFGFQLTPGEREELKRRAKAQGVLLADYIRKRCGLDAPATPAAHIHPRDVAALMAELGRIGNNLNQLAHHANAERRLPEESLLREVLTELKAALNRIV